jgi:TRAP-type C4-dicarboxylate transport system substrate-binding protein
MKIATATINDTQHEWMKRFQKRMEAKAAGRVTVQLYPASQLGDISRMIEGMQLGTVEAFVGPSVFFVGVDPRNQVTWAPGLWDDIDHCWRTVMDDRFRDYWFPIMDKVGIGTISIFCTGVQAFLTKKEITKLDDLKGLKIRVLASELEIKPMQAIGVAPTPLNFADIMPALQTNAIDGVSSIPILFNALKMYSVAKHITVTGLFKSSVPVYVSKVWWDKLPADLRSLMLGEARKVEQELIAWNEVANNATFENWKQNGGTVGALPPDDQAQLIKITTPVAASVLESKPGVKEAYQKTLEVAAATR